MGCFSSTPAATPDPNPNPTPNDDNDQEDPEQLYGASQGCIPKLTKAMKGKGKRGSSWSSSGPEGSLQSLTRVNEGISKKVQKLLETDDQWDFDIILLEELTEKRPLVYIGLKIFGRFNLAKVLHTDESTLKNWLSLIESNYHGGNAYHNSTHAADVLQSTAYFLSTDKLKTWMSPLDEVISLLSAVVHDVDHPGKTNAFLKNSTNKLALLYNDFSILESHHAAFTYKLTLSNEEANIFKNLNPEMFKTVRESLIDMVLATEMTKHFEHLSKFVNVFSPKGLGGPKKADVDLLEVRKLGTPEKVILIKRMLIKCADVSNPTRPVTLSVEWAKRITEEYFRQTEEEIETGLKPAMPMFDRRSCNVPKSQTGFIDYFVAPLYEAWDEFLDLPEVMENLKYNYDYWKELDRMGLRQAVLIEEYLRKNPPPSAEAVIKDILFELEARNSSEQSYH